MQAQVTMTSGSTLKSLLHPGAPCLYLPTPSTSSSPPLCSRISFTLPHSSSALFLFLFIFLESSFGSCFLCLLLVCLFSPLRLYISEFLSLSSPSRTLSDACAVRKCSGILQEKDHVQKHWSHWLRAEACRMSLSSWGRAHRKCLMWPWVGRATLVSVVLMVLALWATWEGRGLGQDTVSHTLSHPPLRDQGVPPYITSAFLCICFYRHMGTGLHQHPAITSHY